MNQTKPKELEEEILLPSEVQCEIANGFVKIKGPKGSASKKLDVPGVAVSKGDGKVIIHSKYGRKKGKKLVGTFKAHIKNMIKGVIEGSTYKLKICSGHFPMNVSVSGKEFVIKNFLGEKTPRKTKILEGAEVKIDGTIITVESSNKEISGQMAANIERLAKIRKKDLRIFQDGIYIISKDGKDIK